VECFAELAAARGEHLNDVAAFRIDLGDVAAVDPGVTAERSVDAARMHDYARHRAATPAPCFESSARITIVSPEVRMNEGRCLCRQVSWQLDGPLELMSHCHCSRCRKSHGTPFATYVAGPAGSYRLHGS